ncbi:hypothetical protein QVA66_07060 [Staphylococcus chromogenes]|nr:hypothetical protein [Staphylococcus chromogenes]
MSRSTKLAIGLLVALLSFALLCFATLGGAFLNKEEQRVAAVSQPTPTAQTKTQAVTQPAPKPTPSPTTTSTLKPTTVSTAKPTTTRATTRASISAPAGAVWCADGRKFKAYAANKTTSCGFAKNVLSEMEPKAGAKKDVKIKAESDATRKTYDVTCSPAKEGAFVCRGGDNATVHLIPAK